MDPSTNRHAADPSPGDELRVRFWLMAVVTSLQTVDTTRIVIVPKGGANPHDEHQLVLSKSSGDVYVGGPDVTVGNGFLIGVGESLALPISLNDEVWAVAAAAQTIRSLETRR